jgi:DNA-binding transcriptional MerR regulator
MRTHHGTEQNEKDFIGALQRFEPDWEAVYTIEAAEHITHTPRRTILIYCKNGLISPVSDPAREGFYFDGDAIRTLRWIEFLRSDYGVNLAGIKVILRLVNEVERLREEPVFQSPRF